MDERAALLSLLAAYRPVNAQEEADRELIRACLLRYADVFTRENRLCHMTASAWITNPAHDRVLLAYHRIYNSWAWLGGHADGDCDLLQVALREAREESGLPALRVCGDAPISLEALPVSGHEKRGAYVPSHLHLNLTYLLEADDSLPLRAKADENAAVRWFTPAQALTVCDEAWFCERIYPKLNARL